MLGTLNPLEHAVFQRVFGEIMTLLIALEFNHTLQYVISRDRGSCRQGHRPDRPTRLARKVMSPTRTKSPPRRSQRSPAWRWPWA